ncbi:UNVERIFIED_CONTAM: hypothetical protein K2H54_035185 [Gekko kuhli]
MFFVVLSYGAVILTLMKSSRQGNRMKSFSTISFHLAVVALFYGPVAGSYVVPAGESETKLIKVITLFYTAMTPFLNPMIYCLRNDRVKEALGSHSVFPLFDRMANQRYSQASSSNTRRNNTCLHKI